VERVHTQIAVIARELINPIADGTDENAGATSARLGRVGPENDAHDVIGAVDPSRTAPGLPRRLVDGVLQWQQFVGRDIT
jgi:hypothetical protein